MNPQPSPQPFSEESGLLASCRHLAQQRKETGLTTVLKAMREPDHTGLGAFFTQLQDAIRRAGLRPLLVSLSWEKLAELPEHLPVIVEFKGCHYRVLSGLDLDQGQVELIMPHEDPTPQARPLEQFRQAWSGGVFLFERINTALVCFLLIAQSADLDISQDRLEREYGLNREEIPQNTLLKMAKDLGLYVEVWHCSWGDLCNLRQAWPAMGVMRNGQHVLLLDMTADQDGAPLIELYDPLREDRQVRMPEQQFRVDWSGKVFLFATE